ncbi:hypothetical protein PUN28_001608 [Cardiocondyla obscurior]|uniref:Uncharacterized protein n=1 Tax=Cardiocondyla obscurior TaxID=286306 RepID=A0AAW2GQC9_9HYME
MGESRDRDAVTRKMWTERRASEKRRVRERENGREKRKAANEERTVRRRRNANALSTRTTKRKKEDGKLRLLHLHSLQNIVLCLPNYCIL